MVDMVDGWNIEDFRAQVTSEERAAREKEAVRQQREKERQLIGTWSSEYPGCATFGPLHQSDRSYQIAVEMLHRSDTRRPACYLVFGPLGHAIEIDAREPDRPKYLREPWFPPTYGTDAKSTNKMWRKEYDRDLANHQKAQASGRLAHKIMDAGHRRESDSDPYSTQWDSYAQVWDVGGEPVIWMAREGVLSQSELDVEFERYAIEWFRQEDWLVSV